MHVSVCLKKKVDLKTALKRYRDIESGKVLPTFIEFFKLAIIFGFAESANLKELYPTHTWDVKKGIEKRKKELAAEKNLKRKT